MLISQQLFLEKTVDKIKLCYCSCFCTVMLKSWKPIIELSIDLSQFIYHFSSSSIFFSLSLGQEGSKASWTLSTAWNAASNQFERVSSCRVTWGKTWEKEGKEEEKKGLLQTGKILLFPTGQCTSSCSLLCLQSPYLLLKDLLHLLLPSCLSQKSHITGHQFTKLVTFCIT